LLVVGLAPRRPEVVAVVERLAEQPHAALVEPSPVNGPQPCLGAGINDQPAPAVSAQLAVALALAQPGRTERVQRPADAEADGSALDRVGEGGQAMGSDPRYSSTSRR
jgi:hypothetical protein